MVDRWSTVLNSVDYLDYYSDIIIIHGPLLDDVR